MTFGISIHHLMGLAESKRKHLNDSNMRVVHITIG
uniref:Uncharacterized protein n=1 Tax=Parascaris equorum TaxID=6256 RepID=A0A914RC54_PAREQ